MECATTGLLIVFNVLTVIQPFSGQVKIVPPAPSSPLIACDYSPSQMASSLKQSNLSEEC